MKKIYLLSLLLLFSSTVSEAFAFSETDSVTISYGGSTLTNAQGSGMKRQNGAAVCFKPTDLTNYVNNYITDVRFYVGSSTQIDSVKVFVSDGLTGDMAMTKAVAVKTNSWNQVRLATPYYLTGDSVFVGYMLWGRDYPMAMFESTAATRTDNWKYSYSSKTWANLPSNSGGDADAFAIQAIVKGDNLPLNNVYLISAPLPAYATVGKEYTISGWITNRGAATLKSLEFEVSTPGHTDTYTLEGLNVLPGNPAPYTVSGIVLKETGEYKVKITVTKVNGMADIDPSDNTVYDKVNCQRDFTARNVLVEHFTSELCTGCPLATGKIEAACEEYPNTVQVSHHAGYYSDPWTIQESWDIYTTFCPVYRFNPVMMLDRTNMTSYGASSGYANLNCPFINPDSKKQSEISGWVGIADAVPALAKVEVTNHFDYATSKATVTVSGEALLTMPDTAFVHLYLMLDSVATTSQSNAPTKPYYHRHMVRKIVTPIWGEQVSMTGGFSVTYDVTVTQSDLAHTSFVAFLSAYNAGNLNDRKVYNAAECQLDMSNVPNSIGRVNADANFTLYVEPGSHTITLQSDGLKAEAYGTDGSLLGTSEGRSLRVDHSGVILVKMHAADGTTRVAKVVM